MPIIASAVGTIACETMCVQQFREHLELRRFPFQHLKDNERRLIKGIK